MYLFNKTDLTTLLKSFLLISKTFFYLKFYRLSYCFPFEFIELLLELVEATFDYLNTS